METFIFHNVDNENIKIEIKALNYDEAVQLLEATTKYPKEFQTKP